MDMTAFAEHVRPLAEALRAISLDDPATAEVALAGTAPLDGPLVTGIGELAFAGAEAGWLVPKEHRGVRFGRVSKDLCGFSVDAVVMDAAGPKHRHPTGEIDLMFSLDGTPQFDGRAPGWAVFPPDSVHVPTVVGGRMLILYFLPGGEIEWL